MMRPLTIALASLVLLGLLFGSATANASTADNAQARAELHDALQDALPWPDARVEVREARVVGTWPDAPRRWDLPDSRSLDERVRVRVTGAEGGQAWVSATLDLEVPVWTAARTVDRGASVSNALRVELMPVGTLPHDAVYADESLAGMVARMPLRAGDPVRRSSVEAPIAIERQQLVAVVARRGAVVVDTRAVALESGRVGDVIRLRNVGSESLLSAVVTGVGRAEVP